MGWNRQPQQPAPLNISNPLCRGISHVIGPAFNLAFPYNTATGAPWGGVITGATLQVRSPGRGLQIAGSTGYLTIPGTAGTGGWTYLAIVTPTVTTAQPIATLAEAPGDGTQDRSLYSTTSNGWASYLYDGAPGGKDALSGIAPVVGRTVFLMARGSSSQLSVGVDGIITNTAVSNAGYDGFATPELIVGYGGGPGALGGGGATTGSAVVHLFVRLGRAISDAEYRAWLDAPWQVFRRSAQRNVSVPVVFTHTASGGLTFGGAASASQTANYAVTAAGGITFAGAVTASQTANYTVIAAGGIVFSGGAAVAQTSNYAVTATGGLVFGGAAATIASAAYAVTATGGIVFAGAAATEQTAAYVVSAAGGIVFSGASTALQSADYVVSAVGGLTFAGAATTSQTAAYAVSGVGGITFGGSATYEQASFYVWSATGGIVFNGAAAVAEANDYVVTADGGILFAGAAAFESMQFYEYLPTGGIVFGGEAASEGPAVGVVGISDWVMRLRRRRRN